MNKVQSRDGAHSKALEATLWDANKDPKSEKALLWFVIFPLSIINALKINKYLLVIIRI